MSNTTRIQWIDFLRSIGLMLVILGHVKNVPSECSLAIYSFHMPLFFILSGYLWNERSLELPFKTFACKKAKSLLLPYIKIAFVCLLVWGIITPPLLADFNLNVYFENIRRYVIGIGYSIGTTEWLPLCSPIWFLTSLFVANIVFYGYKKQRYSLLIWGILIVAFAISNIGFPLPWNIGSALYGAWFMWLGNILKRREKAINMKHRVLTLLLVISIVSIFGFTFVNMDGNEYGNRFLFWIEACGICSVIILFTKEYNRHFSTNGINIFCDFIARNSIAVFGYNYSINRVVSVILKKAPQYDVWYIRYGICIALMLSFIYVVDKIKLNKYLV